MKCYKVLHKPQSYIDNYLHLVLLTLHNSPKYMFKVHKFSQSKINYLDFLRPRVPIFVGVSYFFSYCKRGKRQFVDMNEHNTLGSETFSGFNDIIYSIKVLEHLITKIRFKQQISMCLFQDTCENKPHLTNIFSNITWKRYEMDSEIVLTSGLLLYELYVPNL